MGEIIGTYGWAVATRTRSGDYHVRADLVRRTRYEAVAEYRDRCCLRPRDYERDLRRGEIRVVRVEITLTEDAVR